MLRPTVQAKAEQVKETTNLIQKHKVLGIASLHKVRTPQLQELKKKLNKSAHISVIKNSIIKRAIDECKDKPELEKLEEHLTGANIFLFTNLNPFKLALLLQKNKIKATAKANDTAAEDVTVPAGNTGMPPGPIISQLAAVGLRSRIEGGSVWITHDTQVAKKGDIIPLPLATILSKLGIKPVEIGLTLKTAYEDGIILNQEQLQIDLEKFQQTLQQAHTNALSLTLNAAYPTPENITPLLQIAHQQAYILTLNANITTPQTVADLIRKAHTEMLSLNAKLASINKEAASTTPVQKG